MAVKGIDGWNAEKTNKTKSVICALLILLFGVLISAIACWVCYFYSFPMFVAIVITACAVEICSLCSYLILTDRR